MVELCWFHHRLVHEGGWTLRSVEDGEVVAITPTGNLISSFVDPPDTIRSTIAERIAATGMTIDSRTITPDWWHDPLHLGDIVAGLEWHDAHRGGEPASLSARSSCGSTWSSRASSGT